MKPIASGVIALVVSHLSMPRGQPRKSIHVARYHVTKIRLKRFCPSVATGQIRRYANPRDSKIDLEKINPL